LILVLGAPVFYYVKNLKLLEKFNTASLRIINPTSG